MLDHAKLCRIHTGLLEKDPEEVHEALYRAYPKFRGYEGASLDLGRFQATFVLGLAQTYMIDPKKMTRTAFLVSPTTEKWAMDQLDATLRQVFDQCKREARINVAQYLGKALGHLLVGNRVLQIEEPSRWVAFGFIADASLPEWMRDALLTGV